MDLNVIYSTQTQQQNIIQYLHISNINLLAHFIYQIIGHKVWLYFKVV